MNQLDPTQWAGVATAAIGGLLLMRGQLAKLATLASGWKSADPPVEQWLTGLRHLAGEQRDVGCRAKCFEALDHLDALRE